MCKTPTFANFQTCRCRYTAIVAAAGTTSFMMDLLSGLTEARKVRIKEKKKRKKKKEKCRSKVKRPTVCWFEH